MAKDIIYDQEIDDIVIKNGDFLLREDDDTRSGSSGHAESILLDSPGQWYQSPLLGVGLRKEINGNAKVGIKNEISRQLKDDSFKINQIIVTFEDGLTDISVDANK